MSCYQSEESPRRLGGHLEDVYLEIFGHDCQIQARCQVWWLMSCDTTCIESVWLIESNWLHNGPYSRRGHVEQKARLGWQIYRKFARQYVNRDVTSLLLNVPVT